MDPAIGDKWRRLKSHADTLWPISRKSSGLQTLKNRVNHSSTGPSGIYPAVLDKLAVILRRELGVRHVALERFLKTSIAVALLDEVIVGPGSFEERLGCSVGVCKHRGAC